MRALLVVGALAEVAAALLFAAALGGTLIPVVRGFAPAPLFLLGAAGFVAQAALGLIRLAQVDAAAPSILAESDAVLVTVQLYSFLLPFVFAVGLRALPGMFGSAAAGPRTTWPLAGLLALGVALSSLGSDRPAALGALLLAAALALGAWRSGIWRAPERMRASSRHTVLM